MKGYLRAALIVVGASILCGCWRDSDGVYVTAPFNDQTKLAEIEAVWRNTGEERAFADATRLAEPEVRFQYRVDVVNRLEDRLYVRIGNLELVDADSLSLGSAAEKINCVLDAGKTEALLDGSVWIPKRAAKKVADFRLERYGVPLSERGRAMYREWLLQTRPGEEAEIDADLTRYANTSPCR